MSFTLYVLVTNIVTILTKTQCFLASVSSDIITADFTIQKIVLHLLTLILNIGFTVNKDFFMSVTFFIHSI